MNDDIDFNLLKMPASDVMPDGCLRLIVFETINDVRSIKDIFEGDERFILNEMLNLTHEAGLCSKWRVRK